MGIRPLRNMWADIRQGKNVELYFTVLICLAVVVLSTLDVVDLKTVTSAILAVLSLEAVSLLTNRRTEQSLKKSMEEVLEHQNRPRLSKVFTPFSEGMQKLGSRLMQADDVWILSRTCRRLWYDYQEELQAVAKRGGLRLLFLNPDNGALDMVTRSATWQQPGDGERIKADVDYFVSRLEHIQTHLHLNELAVRLIDYLPAWTLILINPRKNDGIIWVELATYRSHPRKRPSFMVECSLDNDLFDQFRAEFEQMWQDAHPAWEQAVPEPL